MNAKNKGFIVLFPENSNCAYFVLNVVSSEMTKRKRILQRCMPAFVMHFFTNIADATGQTH